MASSGRSAARLDAKRAGALTEQHDRIDHLVEKLQQAAQAGDRAAVLATWDETEREIERHFSAEEAELLPRFRKFQAQAASSRFAEHTAIRALMSTLSVEVELGLPAPDGVARLARLLEEHAAHERVGLYRWADHCLMAWVWQKVRRVSVSGARQPGR